VNLGVSASTHRLVKTILHRPPRSDSNLIALTVASLIVLVSLSGWNWEFVGELLPVSRSLVFEQHQWWRPWTACFAHADLGHLLSNLFLFVIFARFLGGHFGYWLFPFWILFLGGLANLIVLPSYDPETRVLGASGMVNVIGGVWLSLYFFISRQYRLMGRILRTIGVGLLLFAPQEFRPQVAERVHIAGLIWGLGFGTIWFQIFKNEIRSFEVWEPIPKEDPEDELPPPEGLRIRDVESQTEN
jgi:rhomboid protease GluP